MRRIAVDAMGSDGAPHVEVEGSLRAVHERPLEVVLVGDEPRLQAALVERGGCPPSIKLRHASQVVSMEDAPAHVIKTKRDASMRVCFDLLQQGEVEAVVSAGNSGAMLAFGVLVAKRITGVDRPGIAALCPTGSGRYAVFIDVGANTDVRALTLAQYGVMGAACARAVLGCERPQVAILANGEEEAKGTALTRRAHQMLVELSASRDFDYVGYAEGCDLFAGKIDVFVTDGFTGNVALKTAEGVAHVFAGVLRQEVTRSPWTKLGAWLARPALRRLERRLSWDEYGGAPLLGVRGAVIVCHGRSNPNAIKNALLTADRLVGLELSTRIAEGIVRHATIWQGAAGEGAKV